MTANAHLWAIGYEDVARAEAARDKITNLAWGIGRADRYLLLYDVAVVVRHSDGSFTVDRQPFPVGASLVTLTLVGFLAGLALAAPLAGAAVGALLGGAVTTAMAAKTGISDDFVRDVENLIQPGTCTLFILDDSGDMETILHAIQGLGGTVLKTNVDPKQAKLIQSTLTAVPTHQT